MRSGDPSVEEREIDTVQDQGTPEPMIRLLVRVPHEEAVVKS